MFKTAPRLWRRMVLAGVLVALASSSPFALDAAPNAKAGEGAEKAKKAAMSALQLAKFHYDKQEFDAASKLLLQAFAIDPRPEFLYNAARAEQRAVKLDLAEKHFKQCAALPNVSQQIATRIKMHLRDITAMRAVISKAGGGAGGAKTGGADGPAAAVESKATWKPVAGWSAVGVGAVLSGVAGWLLASWSSDQDAMDEKMADKNKAGHVVGIDEQTYKTEQNDLNSRVNLGVATTAIGVAALGAGAWMLLTAPDDVALAPLPAAGGKGIAFLVRF